MPDFSPYMGEPLRILPHRHFEPTFSEPHNVYDPQLLLLPGQIDAALNAHTWAFAKTMPEWPHSYLVRKNWSDPIPWENVVQFIRIYGRVARFNRRHRRMYWCWGGFRYWTMGCALNVTSIINRDDDVPVPYLTFE
ncbi:MAG: hypothetical protein ACOVKC_03210 [Brevundimonas sp.]